MNGSAAADKIHILVTDDDARIRSLLLRFLKREGFTVMAAADAAEARELIRVYSFDIMIFDIMMPDEDGISLARYVRSIRENQPILMLTALGETEDRIRGLETGADDYLTKPFEPRELLLRINAVLRRVSNVTKQSDRMFFGNCRFDCDRDILIADGKAVTLTSAELRLLKILASSPGTVFSREELLEKSEIEGNERTIDVQVTRLRRRIEPDPKFPIYLQTSRGRGYILKPD